MGHLSALSANGLELHRGDYVQRLSLIPDSKPTGKPIQINNIIDHCPVDGPRKTNEVILLDDFTWEFSWNLHKVTT